jgi:hypothetical protein
MTDTMHEWDLKPLPDFDPHYEAVLQLQEGR